MDDFGSFTLMVISFILLQASVASDYENTVCVLGKGQVPSCSSPIVHVDNLTENLQNSSKVTFYGNISLTKLLRVEKKRDIKFMGASAVAIIYCSKNAGFLFERVQEVMIDGIQLQNCGAAVHYKSRASSSDDLNFSASIFVLDCTNISIVEVIVSGSSGMDLLMKNSFGEVSIAESTFTGVQITGKRTQLVASGVSIEFEHERVTENIRNEAHSDVVFSNCIFGPLNYSPRVKKSKLNKITAALTIFFGKNSMNNTITISSCNFSDNHSSRKGALYMLIKNNATGNSVKIHNSKFERNSIPFRADGGGGGVRVDMIEELGFSPSGNRFTFFNCSFVDNQAKLGGGVFINSSKIDSNCFLQNMIIFTMCTWMNNSARYGSAIDAVVAEGNKLLGKLLLLPFIANCTFAGNFIRAAKFDQIVVYGKGVVSAIYFHINFIDKNVFENNIGSPLYLSSSSAEFAENSTTTFENNIGLDGGAISLLGHSFILAHSGSMYNFTNNTAFFKGGAIAYVINDGHDYLSGYKCFLQYASKKPGTLTEVKPRFLFHDNSAGYQYNSELIGKSIYATSLVPCNRECGHYRYKYTANINDTFSCVGTLHFNRIRKFEVATGEWIISVSNYSSPLDIIPGKTYALPLETLDELNQTLNSVYRVVLWRGGSTNTAAKVAPPYRYSHKNEVVLHGKPSNAVYELRLTTEHNREIRLSITVVLVPCPPGYSLLNESECRCSADLGAKHRHQGIHQCNRAEFQAKLQSGYWVGYSNNSMYTTLISSVCPRGFCFGSSHSMPEKDYLLPKKFLPKELDRLICGESRTGLLCSACRENRSVHFHSNYRCKSNKLCTIGWLFYGISELLPVTGIFLIVTAFNVQLTSGSVNGLILYYQLMDTMLITGNDLINFPNATYHAYKAHRFISQMFNFDFFSTDKLSFCLWKGATNLDILAFKYVTVTYSFEY